MEFAIERGMAGLTFASVLDVKEADARDRCEPVQRVEVSGCRLAADADEVGVQSLIGLHKYSYARAVT